ncbi:Isopentenyl-diphosphate Delta-isomerase II [Dionaea muscipula]
MSMSTVVSRIDIIGRRIYKFNKPSRSTSHSSSSYSFLFTDRLSFNPKPRLSSFSLFSSFRSSSSSSADTVVPAAAAAAATTAMANADVDAHMDAVQRRLMFDDECILVDENDHVVGHDSKYNCHLMEKIDAGKSLHRAFSVFLFNSKYELLLQQRSSKKVTFPLVWTNTCCSHPLYRESELIEQDALGVRNAAQRKLLDELGIPAEDVPVDEFIPLGRMLYKAPSDGKWGEHELDYLLFIIKDVKLHPNADEVADVKYVGRQELKELCKKADAGRKT